MRSRTHAYLFPLVALALSNCAAPDFDLIVTGGSIIDGSGRPAYTADVGIKDGRILEIGDLTNQRARRTIDATGLVVAPGFIDMMGGSSLPLLRDPVSAESKLRQGITTMLAGEGLTIAPVDDRLRELYEEEFGFRAEWSTFQEYFSLLADAGIALNVVHNVGAAQVRRIVIGDEDRPATPEQLTEMKDLVAQAMRDGAVGLSSNLINAPGSHASTEELIELAKTAAENGGVYLTHMRNESGQVLEAIDEAIRIGTEAGIPVHIFHLKAAGRENWPLMAAALDRIEQARQQGLEVTADVYPYIRSGISLGMFLHPRHYARGVHAFLSTLSDPAVRQSLRWEVETTSDWENWYRHVGSDWSNVLISAVGLDGDASIVGLSIQEAADQRGHDVWQTFFDLVQTGRVGVNPKCMNEEQKHQAMRAPFMCFDTDASPTNPTEVVSTHPRAFGSFPRVLAKYVREEGVITLEEAIRKLASLPAEILRLEDRGRIATNMIADLVVFDPEAIQDRATFTAPLAYAEGIDFMVVGGELVIDERDVTDARPGEVIRHGQ